MMYSNKLVSSIKVDGKVLREFKDQVYIKFGSEYSIFLKNLNTKRVMVTIHIDGNNVTPNALVLNPNEEVTLERSLANGSLTVGNKFKFIELTPSIEKHRGIKSEDGLIRIEFQFEKQFTSNTFMWNDVVPYNGSPKYVHDTAFWGSETTMFSSRTVPTTADISGPVTTTRASLNNCNGTVNDTGITVPGGKSEQRFSTVSRFPLETEKHVMIFKLLGQDPNAEKITQTIDVSKKATCVTCNRKNKITAHYCSNCGTALELFN